MDGQLQAVSLLEIVFIGIGTYYDVKEKSIPIAFLWAFAGVGSLANIFLQYQSARDAAWGAMIGVAVLFVGWFTKEAIGYGDGWIFVILGLLEGPFAVSLIMIEAFMLSAFWGAWKLVCLKQKRDSTMPFLPFLLIVLLGRFLL